MKTFIIAATMLVAFLAYSDFAHGQTSSDLATYTVVQDDHVWGIISAKCGAREAFHWQSYLDMPQNSALKIPRSPNAPRQFITKRGDPGWLIYAGESITLPTSRCSLTTSALVPVLAAQSATTPPLTKADIEALLDHKLAGITANKGFPWAWVLFALALILAALLAGRLFESWRFDDALAASRQREDESRRRESEAYRREHEARKETLQAKDETIQALRDQSSTLEDSLEAANDRYTDLLGIFTDTRKMEHHRSFGGIPGLGIPELDVLFGKSAAGLHLTINTGDHCAVSLGDSQTVTVTTEQNVETKEPAYT